MLLSSCAQPPAPPAPPPKPPLELIGEWGTRGDGPGQLSRPVSIAADFAGNIYIADAGSKYIHKFDPTGKPLLSFQDWSLKSPAGIAVDRGGGIYVTDATGNQVLIFKPDGERFARIRTVEGGRLSYPSGVAVASDGTFCVTDLDGTRVTSYDGRLRPVRSWRLPEGPLAQKGASADVVAGNGTFFVTNPRAPIVYVTNSTGPGEGPERVLADVAGVTPETQGPLGLGVSERHVFLVNAANSLLTIWSADDKLLLNHALPSGSSDHAPFFVDVVWSPRGELLVLDAATPRVVRFRLHL